jgi:hypothetical protein
MKWSNILVPVLISVIAASCVTLRSPTPVPSVKLPQLRINQQVDVLLPTGEIIDRLKFRGLQNDTLMGIKSGKEWRIPTSDILAIEASYDDEGQRQRIAPLVEGTGVKVKLKNGTTIRMELTAVSDLKLVGRSGNRQFEINRSEIVEILIRTPKPGQTVGLVILMAAIALLVLVIVSLASLNSM